MIALRRRRRPASSRAAGCACCTASRTDGSIGISPMSSSTSGTASPSALSCGATKRSTTSCSWLRIVRPSPAALTWLTTSRMCAALLQRRQHLDRRVGIGHRGRLGRDDDQHVVGERDRVQHHVGDAGAGVEQDPVEARRELLDDVGELVAHLRRQARILDQPGAGEQHREAAGRRQDRVLERRLAGEHVVQRDLGKQVEHHVEVGQAEVGVEHQHALAALGQRRREVGRDEGLADAALAAGHRQIFPWRSWCPHACGSRRGAAPEGASTTWAARRRAHSNSWNCEVPNSRPFSSGLTSETAGCSRQARLRPSDLAR